MEPSLETLVLPKNPAMRRAWLVYQLRLRGLTLSELARREGVSRVAISRTMVMPNSHLEPVIAHVLGITPQELFADRFDASGRRLHPTRERQRITQRRAGNRKASEGAGAQKNLSSISRNGGIE